MSITSISYFVFVAISLCIYLYVPHRGQWIVLLVDSILFYFLNAKPYTIIYLLVSVLTVYGATVFFTKSQNVKKKRIVLALSIVVNVGILASLKYTNLFINSINWFQKHGEAQIPNVQWIASLAISFYTLQLISYLLDCYWGVVRPIYNPIKVFLYASYFPLMVSGPINRMSDFGVQLFEEHRFEYKRITNGMKRIAWGLLKKLAISNRIASMVDILWNSPEIYDGAWIVVAVFLYVIQLYTDFSGCMDIVIGVAACFGIILPENFMAPFFSKNIQEFWRRWHITLGTWLRDYIMNPILKSEAMYRLGEWGKGKFGKKRGKKIPVYFSMLVLWTAMGVWHGDSWKYIIGEGFWFWLVIVIGELTSESCKSLKQKMHIKEGKAWNIFCVLRTNLIFLIGMLFFRASSLPDALSRMGRFFSGRVVWLEIVQFGRESYAEVGLIGLVILAIALILLVIFDYFLYNGKNLIEEIGKWNFVVRWAIYYMVFAIVILSFSIGGQEFTYAQF